VADDNVEPKPGKIEASGEASDVGFGDVKPTVLVKPVKVKIPFQDHIGKIEEKPKSVPTGVDCKVRDTASFFTSNERWREQEELLGWVTLFLLATIESLFY